MSLPAMNSDTHRPWPIPRSPWVGSMTWRDLLFMHWPIPEPALRPHIPPGIQIDRFDGDAWIGVIPFHMTGVRPRGLPRVLGMAFPELNVRTYVRHNDKSGVWFFSLDAASRLAVWTARRYFKLPYRLAGMSVSLQDGLVRYSSYRTSAPEVRLRCRYAPSGEVVQSAPGAIEHWLTERYCLYTASKRGEILRGDIDHARWPLQPATVDVEHNTMSLPIGITLPQQPRLAHFSKRLDAVAWRLEVSV